MKKGHFKNRGSALLTSIIFVAIIMVVTSALLFYSSYAQRRAIQVSRAEYESSCAESGLQIARSYFADPTHSRLWNSYLGNPAVYNPFYSAAFNTTPSLGNGATLNWATLKGTNPDLFYDLDGDGKEDVYIYIRDNADESTTQNYAVDIDQNVYVGGVCISSTLTPRKTDGTTFYDTKPMVAEGLLSMRNGGCQYTAQHGNCLGNGNQN